MAKITESSENNECWAGPRMIRGALSSYREVKSREGALSSEGRRLCSGSLRGEKGAWWPEGRRVVGRHKRKRRSVRKKVHQDIECQAFWRALSVTKGPYNSEGRQVWMGWEYGKWQRGRSVSEWHQTFIRVLKRASRPDGRCTVKCMLLQKGAVNYCGCISRIEGAYIRIVGASTPTKRYEITPLSPRAQFFKLRSIVL